jgi:hypothetical protein
MSKSSKPSSSKSSSSKSKSSKPSSNKPSSNLSNNNSSPSSTALRYSMYRSRMMTTSAGSGALSFLVLVVMLVIYYYTAKFMKYVNETPECADCVSNKYYCNTVLRNMLMFVVVYYVLLMVLGVVFMKTFNMYVGGLLVVMVIAMYGVLIWFISCLYHNLKNIEDRNCPCMDKYKNVLTNLKTASVVLYYFMLFVIAFQLVMVAIAVFSRYTK